MRYANLRVAVAAMVTLALSVGNGCGGRESSTAKAPEKEHPLRAKAPEMGPSVAGKKIIKWGWDVPSTALVRKNIRRMEQTGYDGTAIRFYGRGLST